MSLPRSIADTFLGEKFMSKHEPHMAAGKITFQNTRVRFQRIKDAKLFNGWVRSLSSRNAVIGTATAVSVVPGESFRFEVFGTGARAVFEGRLEVVSGTNLGFAVTTPVRALPSNEEMRVKTPNLPATVFVTVKPAEDDSGPSDLETLTEDVSAARGIEGQVVDLSANGLGLVTSALFPKGTWLRIQIDTPWGKTDCIGEVRYCKPMGAMFRLGLRIHAMDRLNRSRFDSLLKKCVA
jgi:RNase P/RNase MRP subunit p29